MEQKNEFFIQCKYGCHNGLIFTWEKDEESLWINVVESKWYSSQRGLLRRIKEKLRRLWFVLRGKEYSLFEMVVDGDKLEEFKEFVASL